MRMPSPVVFVTSIVSIMGLIINVLVMAVILSRGRGRHRFLFASLLLIGAFWDFGIFMIMLRNNFPSEVIQYQYIISIPMNFLPAFSFHFTTAYLNQVHKKITIALYAYCFGGFILIITGALKPISGVYEYSWGTIGRNDPTLANLSWLLVTYVTLALSCWLLLQAYRREPLAITRRHIRYILVSFIAFSVAHLKTLLVYGVDVAFLLPLGMLFIDSFGAVIGIAIVKDRLFDITVIVREGVVYSVLAAFIIFIFDFSQHLIATFFGDIAKEYSTYIQFASIAVVIIAFMPIKQRLEHAIGGMLNKKKIEF